MKRNSRNSVAVASLWLSLVGSPAEAQAPTQAIAAKPAHSNQVPTASVTPGRQYQAGGLHRFLWGNNYRRLWSTPIEVATLDLSRYAGGLQPSG